MPRQEDSNWKRLAVSSQQQHGPGAPDSVRCPRLVKRQLAALGKRGRRRGYKSPECPVAHRTVRWANGSSGQRSTARSTCDTWPVSTVGWAHRTVRCANRSRGPTVRCTRCGRRSLTGLLQWLSGGAPDCPVHHSTEGKIGLQRLLTALGL
jgi:hypothetical protein